jgi:hypothetical protein
MIELRRFSANNLDGVLEPSGIAIDREISSDGQGSLRITASGGIQTIRLFEITGLRLQNEQIVFRAQLRAQGKGKLYSKMMVYQSMAKTYYGRSPGEAFQQQAKWHPIEARHFLTGTDLPDRLELQLIVEEGAGTIWIDDLRLLSGPLPTPRR